MALSRRRIRQIQTQATRQGTRASSGGAQIPSDRAALRSIQQQRRTEVRSVRGAQRIAERTLARGAAQLPSSGLRGRYLRQTAQEFASRQEGLAGQLPSLVAATRQSFRPDIASARATIAADQASQQAAIGSRFNTLLGEARTRQRAKAKTSSTTHVNKAHEFSQAVRVAKLNYLQGPSGTVNGKPAPWRPPYTNERDWSAFVKSVLAGEGVTHAGIAQRAARTAIFEEMNAHNQRIGQPTVSAQFFNKWLKAQLASGGLSPAFFAGLGH